jgi:dsRNA-specific ribonuclease
MVLTFYVLLGTCERWIKHCDPTFPGRFEEYNDQIVDPKYGIWSTRPPKVLADVVESLLGAAHREGGYVTGQRCALHVLAPITLAILQNDVTEQQSHYALMQPQQVKNCMITKLVLEMKSSSHHSFALFSY